MSIHIDTIYIGGDWVTPSSTSKIAIQSPATGELGSQGFQNIKSILAA
jgi:hypothetical protein